MAKNKILIIILPLFNLLQDFLGPDRGINITLDFRQIFLKQFNQCEQALAPLGLDAQKLDNIKYALTAFADECIMHSAWPAKITWMKQSLQLQFFGEHTAGEGFFHRLNLLRQSGINQLDQLEIYSLCLQLGFEGIYKFKNKTQKLDLLTSLDAQILALRGGTSDYVLSPEISALPLTQHSTPISIGWLGLGLLAGILFIFLGYNVGTHLQLRHAVKILTAEMAYDH